MNNVESLIDYLRTIIKVKRNFVERQDSKHNQLLSYKRLGMFEAYDSVLKELDECSQVASDIKQRKEQR